MRNSRTRPVAPLLGLALLMIAGSRIAAPQAQDLTGVWNSNEGTLYYLRQVGNTLWWAGFNPDANSRIAVLANAFHRGIVSAQVFRGTISGQTVTGDWAEVPRQATTTLRDGTIRLVVQPGGSQLHVASQSGGIHLTDLTRTTRRMLGCVDVAQRRDITCMFKFTLKNTTETLIGTDETLLDNLTPYRDNTVVFGTAATQFEVPEGFTKTSTCAYFYNHNDNDGDLSVDFIADVDNLTNQPNFWRTGWLHESSDIAGKLKFLNNRIHTETIMYGRSDKSCPAGAEVVLPGWNETNGNGTLFQGVPIAGDVVSSGSHVFVRGVPVQPGTRLRITGPLVLDCGHHGSCYATENDPNNPDTKNLEIHPVYSIDVLQDFTLPRPNPQLTGTWAGDDVATYYVRQIGNIVWWLGLSRDQGMEFAHVFKGYVQAGTPTIQGDWANVPIAVSAGAGTLSVSGSFCPRLSSNQPGCNSSPAGQWNSLQTLQSSDSAFENPPRAPVFQWKKLYDRTPEVIHLIVPSTLQMTEINNGGEGKGTLLLTNNGGVPIQIQSVKSSLPELKVLQPVLAIAPSSSASVQLTWRVTGDTTPRKKITHSATLGISSSDPLLPFVTVTVRMDVNGGIAQ